MLRESEKENNQRKQHKTRFDISAIMRNMIRPKLEVTNLCSGKPTDSRIETESETMRFEIEPRVDVINEFDVD